MRNGDQASISSSSSSRSGAKRGSSLGGAPRVVVERPRNLSHMRLKKDGSERRGSSVTDFDSSPAGAESGVIKGRRTGAEEGTPALLFGIGVCIKTAANPF